MLILLAKNHKPILCNYSVFRVVLHLGALRVTGNLGWDSEESKACGSQHALISAYAWRKLQEQLLKDSIC